MDLKVYDISQQTQATYKLSLRCRKESLFSCRNIKASYKELKAFLESSLKEAFLKSSYQRGPIFVLLVDSQRDLKELSVLKKTHPLSQVLVVFTSSKAQLMRQCLNKGAFHVFQMPFEKEEFLLVLRKIEAFWDLQKKRLFMEGKWPFISKDKKTDLFFER